MQDLLQRTLWNAFNQTRTPAVASHRSLFLQAFFLQVF